MGFSEVDFSSEFDFTDQMSPAMEQLSLAIPRRDVVSDVVSDEDLAESLWGETRWMEEGQTVSHHVVFVLCRYTLEQANCSSLLGITSVQRSRGLSPSIHLSLSLALASIEYDRSLAI